MSSKFERPHCNEGINLTYSRSSAGRDERNIVAGRGKIEGRLGYWGDLVRPIPLSGSLLFSSPRVVRTESLMNGLI